MYREYNCFICWDPLMSGNVFESTPLVSVIMPTYNGAKYVQEALFSILQQSYSNMEILVCDDASKDQTINLVQRIQDEQDSKNQIQVIAQPHNQGISRNMNTGLEAAKGKYIAILDQDDIRLDNHKIGKQVNFLESNHNYGVVGTNALVDSKGCIIPVFYPQDDDKIRKIALGKCPILHSSTVYNKSLALHLGGYSVKHAYTQDYEMFLKLLKESKGFNIQDAGTYRRLHNENISKLKNKEQKLSALELVRENKEYFPQKGRALICRTGSLILSTLLSNVDQYKKIELWIKNRY